jgi:hypothetical protein
MKVAFVNQEVRYGITALHELARLAPPDNKVRELIAVNVLLTSLLNITVIALRALPFGSYAPIPAPSSPFETIL